MQQPHQRRRNSMNQSNVSSRLFYSIICLYMQGTTNVLEESKNIFLHYFEHVLLRVDHLESHVYGTFKLLALDLVTNKLFWFKLRTFWVDFFSDLILNPFVHTIVSLDVGFNGFQSCNFPQWYGHSQKLCKSKFKLKYHVQKILHHWKTN